MKKSANAAKINPATHTETDAEIMIGTFKVPKPYDKGVARVNPSAERVCDTLPKKIGG